MRKPDFFNATTDLQEKRMQFSIAAIQRATFYPVSVLWGYAIMSLLKYNLIISAVAYNPSLFVAFAAASCLTLPFYFALLFFLQKYSTRDSHFYNIANGLFIFADILATVYIASMFVFSPVSIYFLFALTGAGMIPTLASFKLLEKGTGAVHQFFFNQNRAHTGPISENLPTITRNYSV